MGILIVSYNKGCFLYYENIGHPSWNIPCKHIVKLGGRNDEKSILTMLTFVWVDVILWPFKITDPHDGSGILFLYTLAHTMCLCHCWKFSWNFIFTKI